FHIPVHVSDIDMDPLEVSFDASWDYPDWLALVSESNSLTGTPPEPTSIYFPLHVSDGTVTVTDTFQLFAEYFHPRITSITDVPEDQGGRVYVQFSKSYFDESNTTNQMYTVFRLDLINNDPEWVVVGAGGSIGEEYYTFEVATAMDSTSEHDGMTEFKVVASMNEGIFHSDPVMGYSTDDLAPEVPTGLLAAQTGTAITLNWDPLEVDDFNYFSIHRSESEEFEVNVENLIGYTTELSYLDTTAEWFVTLYYRVNATDFAGNTGPASEFVEGYVHVNFAPTMPEINSQEMDEDQSFELVVIATDENEDDVLTYGALSSQNDVMPSVSGDTLSIALTDNWFGVADITVYVSDGELSDTTLFVLTVNAVNDAPGDFGLISPEDSIQVSITDEDIHNEMYLTFDWEESIDVDNDELEHHFKLYNGYYSEENPDILIDTVLLNEPGIDLSYQYIAAIIGTTNDNNVSGDWVVFTTDGIDTTMSNEFRHISLDASDVLSIDGEMLPTVFALHQNYPNPFNPTTKIQYDLPEDTFVSITIYDVMGRSIRTLMNVKQSAGFHSIRWDAKNNIGEGVSAGMYIYMIQAGEFRSTKKMVLLK
ncbi:MAG: hypothetical protein CMG55_04710, partial [Candidatus Marinimicrobia bacterium]|nr:hypothetical protein [Candidatus Neomarinimicrobiota bacterium]